MCNCNSDPDDDEINAPSCMGMLESLMPGGTGIIRGALVQQ